MNLQDIGARIRLRRIEMHYTREAYAELIDVSPHYIYEIERGLKAMSIYTFDKVVNTLNLSADYLLYGSDSPDSINPKTDHLSVLIKDLPLDKRDEVADVLSTLLPYLK